MSGGHPDDTQVAPTPAHLGHAPSIGEVITHTFGGAISRPPYFLLSKPASRERVLLTKYAVSGTILLAVALLGSAGLVVTAAVMGRPQPLVGMLVSTLLLWLGLLFVLGVALLFSVIFDVCLVAALLPLAGALVLFRRRAY